MHRTTLAATLGVLLLTVSACEGDSPSASLGSSPPASSPVSSPTASDAISPTASGTASTAATPAAPGPSKAASVAYAADTKKICTKIDQLFKGQEMERFAKDLGTLILHKEAKRPAKATLAREAARKDLKSLAAAVRSGTSAAKNPKLKAAGQESAADIEKTAADNAFFAKIKTIKDVNPNLESEITPWLTPLTAHCA